MSPKNLKYNYYEGDIFFINKDQKIEGMLYAVARMNKQQLKGIVEAVRGGTTNRRAIRSIQKLLIERGYEPEDLKNILNTIQFK